MFFISRLKQLNIILGQYRAKDVILLGFFITYLNIIVNSIFSLAQLGYPYTTFLIEPHKFQNLFDAVDRFKNVNAFEHLAVNILPLSTSLYLAFIKFAIFTGNQYLALAIIYFAILICIYFVFRKSGNERSLFLLILLSYPMLYTLDRGNFGLLIFLFIFTAFVTDLTIVSTLAIAFASSINPACVVFVIPLLFKKPALSRILAVLSLFIALMLIINFVAFRINSEYLSPKVTNPFLPFWNLVTYSHPYGDLGDLYYGSSLFMPLLYIVNSAGFPLALQPYHIFLLTTTALMTWLALKRDFSAWRSLLSERNSIFIFSIGLVLFSPSGGDSSLLVLFIPLLIFPRTSFSFGYFVIFGALLGAKHFFLLSPNNMLGSYVSWQVFINPVLLFVLLFSEFNLINFVKRDPHVHPENDLNIRLEKIRYFVAPYINTFIIFATIALAIGVISFRYSMDNKETHNLSMGLPADFDPEIYLRLNPGLEEFWKSNGINDSGPRLLKHSEEHYQGFGSKDGWIYRGTFQKLLYPSSNKIMLEIWQIGLPLFVWFFLVTLLYSNGFKKWMWLTESTVWKSITRICYQIWFQINVHKRTITLILSVAFIFLVILFRSTMAAKEGQNKEAGLPYDFDSEIYLRLNPGLELYWHSIGIHESGIPLVHRPEDHYKGFGARDHWGYRGLFQQIFYPPIFQKMIIVWHVCFPMALLTIIFVFNKALRPIINTHRITIALDTLKFSIANLFRLILSHRRTITLVFIAILLFSSALLVTQKGPRVLHNIKVGLPIDFNAEIYLKINPGLQEFWKSKGINDDGQQLLNHAEEHYKAFGAKEGWKYK